MTLNEAIVRAKNKGRRFLSRRFARHIVPVAGLGPIISFTFDDAPRTAFNLGREILASHGGRATYFVSLALLDTDTEVGLIGSLDDMQGAIETGNELGCHTFDHHDAWFVPAAEYIASVDRNRAELRRLIPGARFDCFAYPKSGPTLAVKSALSGAFRACRGGGQAGNFGSTDLNLVKACFLDRRTGVDMDFIRALVDNTAAHSGWLVFATHDVADSPSPYGCTPEFLDAVAEYAGRSGALLLPFAEASARLSPASSALVAH